MREARGGGILGPFLFAIAAACASREASPRESASSAPPSTVFRLDHDLVTLPLTIVREFPFLSAKVNGVPGKLMFDTGSGDALGLNDRLVPLANGKVVGTGFVGSGQRFEVKVYPTVASIELDGPLVFRDVPDVEGADYGFVGEGMMPDFLGFIGHAFAPRHRFVLDYDESRLTFFRGADAERAVRTQLADARTITVLHFETRKLPNHPILALTIGGIPFVGAFDTGDLGAVIMSRETQSRLTALGQLTRHEGGDEPLVDVTGLAFASGFTTSVSGIREMNETDPSAAPLGIAEPDTISFGYAFLRQYVSIWDFEKKTIELLDR